MSNSENFDIEKWVEERKARWAKIVAMGDDSEIRDPQAIMNMTDEEFEAWSNSN